MPQGQFVQGWFIPMDGPPTRPDLPPFLGKPTHPIVEVPSHPIVLPPLPPDITEPPPEIDEGAKPEHPIFIPERPGKPPIHLPPGWVWPPFDPSDGIQGKALLLCWVPGVGAKWIVVEIPAWNWPGMPPGVKPPDPPTEPPVPPREPKGVFGR